MATVMPLNTTARPAVSMALDGLVALGAVRASRQRETTISE